jgi:hypothetical protein
MAISLGVITFAISYIGYRGWTHPPRPYKQTGVGWGSIVGYKFGMVVGVVLVLGGIIYGVIDVVTR